ncbi:hypothetical protein FACS1894176_08310 [Bacteroidia bacterium]|nr:hypothetical protein FACS1894176_08310 [Bacteroidia bacterium]
MNELVESVSGQLTGCSGTFSGCRTGIERWSGRIYQVCALLFIKPYRRYIGKRTQKKMNLLFRNTYRSLYTVDDLETEKNEEHWIGGDF